MAERILKYRHFEVGTTEKSRLKLLLFF